MSTARRGGFGTPVKRLIRCQSALCAIAPWERTSKYSRDGRVQPRCLWDTGRPAFAGHDSGENVKHGPDCCPHDTTGKTLRPFRKRVQCPALAAKIFFFPKHRTYDLTKPSRARYGGRFAIVTTRGAGCDGRGRAARRAARLAYGQAVWSCPPDAGVKLRKRNAQRRWLKSPEHRGDHGAAVKPLRRECRMFRPACQTCGHFPFQPTRIAGAVERPAFPAPSDFRGPT
jgi:hypothetical protein